MTLTFVIKDENPWNIQSIYELQFFNCPSCVYKNQSKQEFIEHAHQIHPEVINYLNNIQDDSLHDINCPWTITNPSNIKNEPIEYEDYNPLETSEYCETELKSEDEFFDQKVENENFSAVEKPTESEFKCAFCDKHFTSIIKLNRHVSMNHESKKHKCDQCEKSFNKLNNLKRHKLTVHEGVKDFKCIYCTQVFSYSSGQNFLFIKISILKIVD